MKANYLKQENVSIYLLSTSSFFIRFSQCGDVWLFNCFEGCQHILSIKKIKISQIKKIVITENSIRCTSGLLGLLSSISLNTTTDRIDLLGQVGLQYYMFGGRKYSQTNFRYKLYIHELSRQLTFTHFDISIAVFYDTYIEGLIHYVMLFSEEPGSLDSIKAFNYKIPFGPLYGRLKSGQKFILPDGFIICNQDFVSGYFLGYKFIAVHEFSEKKFEKN
uniref:Uncharacterized protein n=1 Tax=Porolithon onkodes TaxID=231751 RepID=A0A2Z2L372_9FLOR|nr:hypothetical protein [Porolithon onkodes]ASB29633.1 hypothetical protein [Porolithon onkodes]